MPLFVSCAAFDVRCRRPFTKHSSSPSSCPGWTTAMLCWLPVQPPSVGTQRCRTIHPWFAALGPHHRHTRQFPLVEGVRACAVQAGDDRLPLTERHSSIILGCRPAPGPRWGLRPQTPVIGSRSTRSPWPRPLLAPPTFKHFQRPCSNVRCSPRVVVSHFQTGAIPRRCFCISVYGSSWRRGRGEIERGSCPP